MKLFTFDDAGRRGVAVEREGAAIDLAAIGVNDMLALIDGGPDLWARAAAADGPAVPASAKRKAPIPAPRRDIFCVGKNYREHAQEFGKSGFDGGAKGGDEVPDHPIIFTKATTSVSGPGDPIRHADDPLDSIDYEGELAVVIGRGGRRISRDDAQAHVFGYTVLNDVTSREAQKLHKQWVLGKGVDGFCPMGPMIVTADELGEIGRLRLTTHVNSVLRQNARVADLIFDVPTLIETISAYITLLPGDIIATGTPAGVGIGFDPPRYLKPGDCVVVEIDGIGILENPVT